MKKLKKTGYTVYHWDTFDNETIPIATKKTLALATKFVYTHYAGRISDDGADVVDIVKNRTGNVAASFHVK